MTAQRRLLDFAQRGDANLTYIYVIISTFDGRAYVGKTNDFKTRMGQHFGVCSKDSRSARTLTGIDRAIYMLGAYQFLPLVVDTCIHAHAHDLEASWIEALNTNDVRIGYNMQSPKTFSKMQICDEAVSLVTQLCAYYKARRVLDDSRRAIEKSLVDEVLSSYASAASDASSSDDTRCNGTIERWLADVDVESSIYYHKPMDTYETYLRWCEQSQINLTSVACKRTFCKVVSERARCESKCARFTIDKCGADYFSVLTHDKDLSCGKTVTARVWVPVEKQ